MRILLAALVAWQLMTCSVFADDEVRGTAAQNDQVNQFKLGQRVFVDRDVDADVDSSGSLPIRRGTVSTIVALDGARALVCDLAPVWLEQNSLLSLAEAREKLLGELARSPGDVDLQIALGNVYRGQGTHDLAVEAYCLALARQPDNVEAIRGRSESFYHAMRGLTCLVGLNRAQEIDADSAKTHYLRGAVLLNHQRHATAIASLDAAIENAPQLVPAWTLRAKAKWQSGDVAGAMSDYDEAIRLCSNCTDAYVGRASYYGGAGDYAAALADLRKAIEINPRDHAAHHKMARLIHRAEDDDIGDARQALVHAKRAADLTGGQNAEYASTLSMAYHKVDDRSRAIDWKNHALRLKIARQNYYRGWRFENTFRHGEDE